MFQMIELAFSADTVFYLFVLFYHLSNAKKGF